MPARFEGLVSIVLFHVRCIGVPSEQEWPEQITLPRSSFRQTITKSLENLVPNAEPAALDLMKVSSYFAMGLHVYKFLLTFLVYCCEQFNMHGLAC